MRLGFVFDGAYFRNVQWYFQRFDTYVLPSDEEVVWFDVSVDEPALMEPLRNSRSFSCHGDARVLC